MKKETITQRLKDLSFGETFILAILMAIGLTYATRALVPPVNVEQAKPAMTDTLDPNDCSRGIDEANQESCDP